MAGSVRFNVTIDSTGHGYLAGSPPYTGTWTGDIDINAISVDWNTKRTMIKISVPKTSGNVTQTPDYRIYDFKRVSEDVNIGGWLEDDATETAWNKFWKLRAVVSRGGKLNTFSFLTSGSAILTFPEALTAPSYYGWLEDITANMDPTDDIGLGTRSYTSSPYAGVARIRVKLTVTFGKQVGVS